MRVRKKKFINNKKRTVAKRHKFEKYLNEYVEQKKANNSKLKYLEIEELVNLLEIARGAKYKDNNAAIIAVNGHLKRINERGNYYKFEKKGYGSKAKIYFKVNKKSNRLNKESIPDIKVKDLPIGYCPLK